MERLRFRDWFEGLGLGVLLDMSCFFVVSLGNWVFSEDRAGLALNEITNVSFGIGVLDSLVRCLFVISQCTEYTGLFSIHASYVYKCLNLECRLSGHAIQLFPLASIIIFIKSGNSPCKPLAHQHTQSP